MHRQAGIQEVEIKTAADAQLSSKWACACSQPNEITCFQICKNGYTKFDKRRTQV